MSVQPRLRRPRVDTWDSMSTSRLYGQPRSLTHRDASHKGRSLMSIAGSNATSSGTRRLGLRHGPARSARVRKIEEYEAGVAAAAGVENGPRATARSTARVSEVSCSASGQVLNGRTPRLLQTSGRSSRGGSNLDDKDAGVQGVKRNWKSVKLNDDTSTSKDAPDWFHLDVHENRARELTRAGKHVKDATEGRDKEWLNPSTKKLFIAPGRGFGKQVMLAIEPSDDWRRELYASVGLGGTSKDGSVKLRERKVQHRHNPVNHRLALARKAHAAAHAHGTENVARDEHSRIKKALAAAQKQKAIAARS